MIYALGGPDRLMKNITSTSIALPQANPDMPTKAKGKSASLARKEYDASPPPNWPPLKPLIPSSDLALETLLEDQIILIRNFFTSTLCKNYVSFLSTLPLVTTPDKPKKGDALRVNDRFQVDDPGFADQLWDIAGLRDLVTREEGDGGRLKEEFGRLWGGEVCGLNPRIRIYRYSKGQFFDQHCRSDFCMYNSKPFPSELYNTQQL